MISEETVNENEKQIPADIRLVRKTLLDERCPVVVVFKLCRYFAQHPEASVGRLNRRLDEIATEFGYQNYGAFKRAGFRPVQQDALLVSVMGLS